MASGSGDSGETMGTNNATGMGAGDNSENLVSRVANSDSSASTENRRAGEGDRDGVRNRVNPDQAGTNISSSTSPQSLRVDPPRAPQQPPTTDAPVPPPRRARAIIDDNSIITRNQLAFLLTVTFGIIVAFGSVYVYKQVQTAYIVSSLINEVPSSRSFNRRPSSPSQPKPTSPKPIDSPISSPSPVTNSYIESKLSPEVEIYAQQLQRVLGSLKRALGRIDKSDNSSQLAGIIEMKPMHEALKEKQEQVMKQAMHSMSDADDSASDSEVNLETDSKSGTESTKSTDPLADGFGESKSDGNVQTKTEKLTEAYSLAAEYVTNLNKIVDEQIRRSKLEEGEKALEENPEFDLEKKKEENVELFRRFVQLVGEAEALDDEYEEDGDEASASASSVFEELRSKLSDQKSDADAYESSSRVRELRTTISNDADDEKTEQDIYNLLSEAFNGIDVDVDRDAESDPWDLAEAKADLVKDFMDGYGENKEEAGLLEHKKHADTEYGKDDDEEKLTSGVKSTTKSDNQEIPNSGVKITTKSEGEESEPEQKSREENSPLFS